MKLFELILLLVLIVCAISVACTRDLLTSIVIFMSYSLVMCVIYGGSRGSWCDKYPFFCDLEKDTGYQKGGTG